MKTFQRTLTALLLAVTCLLCACSSINDVISAKESGKEGTTQSYAVTTDQAWDIAKTVFRWEGADAVEEHRADGFMTTSSGRGFLTAGTVMGAWISDGSDGLTKVTVVTKRRVTTNLVTTLTEDTFQKRFAQAVAMIKAGQKLPYAAPAMPS